MPGFDDRLKQHLERAAPPADPSGAFDRILEKKIRRRYVRRFQAAGLVVAVVAATVGGTWILVRAFESRDDGDRFGGVTPTPGPVRNGLIAFSRFANDNYDIWTTNPDGTDARNLTAGSLDSEYTPSWSPDGTRIAFVKERDTDRAIYVMNSDGSNPVRLQDIEPSNHSLAWSPDGTRIAYVSSGDLVVMNTDGSGAQRITSGSMRLDFSPTWAPDGSWIAFSRLTFDEPLSDDPFEGRSPAGSGLWVVRPDGDGLARLTEGPDPLDGLDESPDWSRDGRRIVFQRGDDIYLLEVATSRLKRLASGTVPSWSPDGERFVFERAASVNKEVYALYVMNADGSGVTQLRIGSVEPYMTPDWQPIPVHSPPSPTPTVEPYPTPTTFPSACDPSIATGDFDGDGQPDKATVARTECLPHEPGDTTEYSLHVQWPPSEGVAPLPDCRKVCRALAATDLNGDGIDEFILQIDEGTKNRYLVYELPASEAFGRPSDIASPGTPEFPAGEPATLRLGGSVEHYVAFGCDFAKHQVIVQIAEPNQARSRYHVHEILLRFDSIESPPFGRFTVVSERDFTEPFGYAEGIAPGDQFEVGDPCWMQF